MNRLILFLFFVLCSLLVSRGQALCLEIVYPGHETYFPRSDFLILKGGSDPPLDAMTIEINGAKSELIDISGEDYRAAFRDFLILQPSFDPGNNLVVVDGYVDGKKVVSTRADVYFLADGYLVPPQDYRPFTMHLPEKEALCAPCHEMNPDSVEIRIEDERANPCASCHRRMLNKSHVHGPAGVYRCVYCHDPDSSPARYQARSTKSSLCNECHLDKVAEFGSNTFVHGPVEVGLCDVCHDPHASDYPAQLLDSTNAVCLGCHEKVANESHVVRGVGGKSHPIGGVPDPSRVGRDLSCASCHDPHAGESPYYFQGGIKGRFSLCQFCHQK